MRVVEERAEAEPTCATALPRGRAVVLPSAMRPQLFVVVDTEEEFDWSAPFSRANTAVTAMKYIGRAQAVFDRYKVCPTYVIDYPVATQHDGFASLREIWRGGRCTIGAHLHPWVTPPYDETISARNSFVGNLPVATQRAKLRNLFDAITAHFDVPKVFKAGRYGLGCETVSLLEELEIEVDTSVLPQMDFTDEGGPSFLGYSSAPFFLRRSVLEIPGTVDYTGWAGPLKPVLHKVASGALLSRARAVGALAKARAVNRVMLSPEGNSFAEMRDLTRTLVDRGCRTFTFSFHSPSLDAGHTPYVQTPAQLAAFIDVIDRYCEFFTGELQGVPSTPLAFRTSVASQLESAS
jgi:hypothetical protein